ncbi:MAG: MFS transporter [Segniliparus sp.]|uniref:MFS transporter n=1 Tax=Segniliparus sp. TaxID=2804064 RepID=UPI003F30949D
MPASARLLAVTTIALGVVYGYDSSIIGGTLFMLGHEFQLDDAHKETLATAAVVGQLIGAALGSPFVEKAGRKRSTFLVAVGFAVFSLFSALAWGLGPLIVARFLVGLVTGVAIVATPVFVAESAPARRRGAMLASYQVACVSGIILGYLCSRAASEAEAWRTVLAVAAAPAVLACVLLVFLPDPPAAPAAPGDSGHARTRLREILRPPYLRGFVFVVGLGAFAQLTGINAVVYYGPAIFKAMGFSENDALSVSTWVQVASLASVLLAMAVVDRLGRRPVLLTGIAVMAASSVLLAVLFLGQTGLGRPEAEVHFSHWEGLLGFAGTAVFTMGFTFGFGALIWTYAGESFPSRLRSTGSSALLTADLLANVVISWQFLTVLHAFGGAGTFAILAAVAAAAFVFVWLLAPETKGREVEEIEQFWANGGRW